MVFRHLRCCHGNASEVNDDLFPQKISDRHAYPLPPCSPPVRPLSPPVPHVSSAGVLFQEASRFPKNLGEWMCPIVAAQLGRHKCLVSNFPSAPKSPNHQKRFPIGSESCFLRSDLSPDPTFSHSPIIYVSSHFPLKSHSCRTNLIIDQI